MCLKAYPQNDHFYAGRDAKAGKASNLAGTLYPRASGLHCSAGWAVPTLWEAQLPQENRSNFQWWGQLSGAGLSQHRWNGKSMWTQNVGPDRQLCARVLLFLISELTLWLCGVSVIFVVRHVHTWISSNDFRRSCPAWRWRRWRIWLQLSSQHQACCFLPLSPSYFTAVVLGGTGVAQSGSMSVALCEAQGKIRPRPAWRPDSHFDKC